MSDEVERNGKSGMIRLTRRALLGAALASIGTGAYATIIEPLIRLRVQHYRLQPPHWTLKKPLRIAAIADPHINTPFMPPAHIARVVARTMAENPDLIVLLGDYRSSIKFIGDRMSADEIAACFAPLSAPLGVFAILGNHDWWQDPDPVVRRGDAMPSMVKALERVDIPVLENNAVPIDHSGERFWLAGLGDQWAVRANGQLMVGRDDLPGTMAQVRDDRPVILLAHEPDIFVKVPASVSLTLCGHTHAGQVRILGWAPIIPSVYGDRYLWGHIIEAGRHLIVSAGIGCSNLPIRIGAPPEIVIVDLFGKSV
jgi:predicted MPP superfamily phosphohydrolase